MELQRAAWCALLSQQAQIRVLGAAGAVSELTRLASSHSAQAILVDATSGQLALAQELSGALSGAGLLFLVDSYDLDEILVLLRAGVSGCLARHESVGELARSLIAVGRGEVALPPHISGRALAQLARGTPVSAGLVEPLSERETEVLRLLAGGLTNKDIAQDADPQRAHGRSAPAQHFRQTGRALAYRSSLVGCQERLCEQIGHGYVGDFT